MVAVEVGHLFNCRSRTRSAFHAFFSNPFIFASVGIVVGLQLLAVFNPFLANVLGLEIPNTSDWIVLGIAMVLPIMIVEFTKVLARRLSAEKEL